MCGQFALFSNIQAIIDYYNFLKQFEKEFNPEALHEFLKTKKDKTPYNQYDFPSHKITPGMYVPVCFKENNHYQIDWMRWGLVPSWSKDESFAMKLINARRETISEKPSFRNAWKSRRCLIPCNYFYEWNQQKQKFEIRLKNHEIFSLAGIWESRERDDFVLNTFSIITQEANNEMKMIHDRMPVIIKESEFSNWLDCKISDFYEINSISDQQLMIQAV